MFSYLQINRLEGQVLRYKTAAENAEKVEDELKAEKRKLQREVLTVLCFSKYVPKKKLLWKYILCCVRIFILAPIFNDTAVESFTLCWFSDLHGDCHLRFAQKSFCFK